MNQERAKDQEESKSGATPTPTVGTEATAVVDVTAAPSANPSVLPTAVGAVETCSTSETFFVRDDADACPNGGVTAMRWIGSGRKTNGTYNPNEDTLLSRSAYCVGDKQGQSVAADEKIAPACESNTFRISEWKDNSNPPNATFEPALDGAYRNLAACANLKTTIDPDTRIGLKLLVSDKAEDICNNERPIRVKSWIDFNSDNEVDSGLEANTSIEQIFCESHATNESVVAGLAGGTRKVEYLVLATDSPDIPQNCQRAVKVTIQGYKNNTACGNVRTASACVVATVVQTPTPQPTATNNAPQLASVPTISGEENKLISFSLVGTDPDNDPLTYSCIMNCPAGLNIAGNVVSWTPTYEQAGTYRDVAFAVSDGKTRDSKLTDISVTNVNRVPVFDLLLVNDIAEGESRMHAISVRDPDGDNITFACISGCRNTISVVGDTLFLTPNYNDAGDVNLVISASDGFETITQNVNFKVVNTNQAPVWTEATRTVDEDVTLSFTLPVTDPDGDALTGTCTECSALGATLNGLNFVWKPSYSQSGTHRINFTFKDPSNATVTGAIVVIVNDINRPPVWITVGGPGTLREGENFSYPLSVTDPDGDSIVISCVSCPAGSKIENSAFVWTPSFTQAGTYNIELTAVDSKGASAGPLKGTLTVENVNRDPQWGTLVNQSVNEGDRLTYSLPLSDPDGDSVSVSCATCPPGSRFTGKTFEWTPSYTDGGKVYTINVTGFDSGGGTSGSRSFTVTVNNVNRAPRILGSFSNQTIAWTGNMFQSVSVSDDADETLTVNGCSGCPTGMTASINSGYLTVRWTPTATQGGDYSIQLSITDGVYSAPSNVFVVTASHNPALIGGRLSIVGGQGVPYGDVSSANYIHYNAYTSNFISLYNSTTGSWKAYNFTSVSIDSTTAGLGPNWNYDVYAYANSSGDIRLAFVGWTSDNARTAPLGVRDGQYVMSSAPAYRYLGVVRTSPYTTFQDDPSHRYILNAHNKLPRTLQNTSAFASYCDNLGDGYAPWGGFRTDQRVTFLHDSSHSIEIATQGYVTLDNSVDQTAWIALASGSTSATPVSSASVGPISVNETQRRFFLKPPTFTLTPVGGLNTVQLQCAHSKNGGNPGPAYYDSVYMTFNHAIQQ